MKEIRKALMVIVGGSLMAFAVFGIVTWIKIGHDISTGIFFGLMLGLISTEDKETI